MLLYCVLDPEYVWLGTGCVHHMTLLEVSHLLCMPYNILYIYSYKVITMHYAIHMQYTACTAKELAPSRVYDLRSSDGGPSGRSHRVVQKR